LYELALLEAVAIPQVECFESAVEFARTEGIISAPEPMYAIAETIREALRTKESGEETTILTVLSGHGPFDLAAYEDFLGKQISGYELPDEAIKEAMKRVPVVG
jgi:tryptophan synthase beta chain